MKTNEELIKETFGEKIDINALRGNYSINTIKCLMSYKEGFLACAEIKDKEIELIRTRVKEASDAYNSECVKSL